MKKLLGFLTFVLMASYYSMASSQENSPLFASISCVGENTHVQIKIQYYSQVTYSGIASISVNENHWLGFWNWISNPEKTQLSGNNYFNIYAKNQNGKEVIKLNSIDNGNGLSDSWLTMPGFEGPVECTIEQDQPINKDIEKIGSCGPIPRVRYMTYCCNGKWVQNECKYTAPN